MKAILTALFLSTVAAVAHPHHYYQGPTYYYPPARVYNPPPVYYAPLQKRIDVVDIHNPTIANHDIRTDTMFRVYRLV